MYCHCEICDKVMYEIFRNIHLQSGFDKRSANLMTKKYIITYPKPNNIVDTIRKYLTSHYKRYEKFEAILSAKLLMPSKQI